MVRKYSAIGNGTMVYPSKRKSLDAPATATVTFCLALVSRRPALIRIHGPRSSTEHTLLIFLPWAGDLASLLQPRKSCHALQPPLELTLMHALRLPSLSAAPYPRKRPLVVAPQSLSSCHVSRVKWLFSGLAIFVVLAWCVRPAYATTQTVNELADNAADTGSLCYALNLAASGDRTVFTPIPAGSNMLKAISLGDRTLSRSLATVTMARNIASPPQLPHHSAWADLRPSISLGGLPLLPAAVLWFPETDDLSALEIAEVPDEPISLHSRAHRWIRIGMLVFLAMGLLGMLFS